MTTHLFTIGFTKKSAQVFFNILKKSNIKRVIDIRLNNASQLSGFTKREDLQFFLREICNAEYLHFPQLAPTQTMLDNYKKINQSWDEYVQEFTSLIKIRRIETVVTPELLDFSCLLCSESTPEKCHRRLVAEYLKIFYPSIVIKHL